MPGLVSFPQDTVEMSFAPAAPLLPVSDRVIVPDDPPAWMPLAEPPTVLEVTGSLSNQTFFHWEPEPDRIHQTYDDVGQDQAATNVTASMIDVTATQNVEAVNELPRFYIHRR